VCRSVHVLVGSYYESSTRTTIDTTVVMHQTMYVDVNV
jgi:hypothetical protein